MVLNRRGGGSQQATRRGEALDPCVSRSITDSPWPPVGGAGALGERWWPEPPTREAGLSLIL